jgi:hypothetical protein
LNDDLAGFFVGLLTGVVNNFLLQRKGLGVGFLF